VTRATYTKLSLFHSRCGAGGRTAEFEEARVATRRPYGGRRGEKRTRGPRGPERGCGGGAPPGGALRTASGKGHSRVMVEISPPGGTGNG